MTETRLALKRSPIWAAILTSGGALGLIVLWRFTPLAEVVKPGALALLFRRLGDLHVYGPLYVGLAFVVGGLAMVPVTAMILAAAILFPPWVGFWASLAGSFAAAVVGYAVGRTASRRTLQHLAGARLGRVAEKVSDQGVMPVLAFRLMPVAPFSVINIVAGYVRLRLVPYLVGSLLGLLPGIALINLFGHRVKRAVQDPSPATLLTLGTSVVFVWLTYEGGRRLLVRLRPGGHREEPDAQTR